MVTPHSVVDALIGENQDAFVLFSLLQRHHWGRNFVLANAMADQLGWTRKALCSRAHPATEPGIYSVRSYQQASDPQPSIVSVHGVVKIDHQ